VLVDFGEEPVQLVSMVTREMLKQGSYGENGIAPSRAKA
jgi:hypothetical protein